MYLQNIGNITREKCKFVNFLLIFGGEYLKLRLIEQYKVKYAVFWRTFVGGLGEVFQAVVHDARMASVQLACLNQHTKYVVFH